MLGSAGGEQLMQQTMAGAWAHRTSPNFPRALFQEMGKGARPEMGEAANAVDDGRCLGAQNAAQKSARPNPRKGGCCKVGGDEAAAEGAQREEFERGADS